LESQFQIVNYSATVISGLQCAVLLRFPELAAGHSANVSAGMIEQITGALTHRQHWTL
jgi:hypothetical protein